MTTSPHLSVIIPTYNRAALLKQTLESVLDQTFSDYEIIVIDDGSTDRTEESVAQLLEERPASAETIRYFRQANQGKSVALNRGLSEVKTEWIAFLDSDDIWLPGKIEQQFLALRQFAPQAETCFTDARYINNPHLSITAFERAEKRFAAQMGVIADPIRFVVHPPHGVYMQTVIVSTHVMRRVGEFDSAIWVGQDTDFLFRLALETQFCFVNQPLVLIDRTPVREEGLIEILNLRDHRYLDERQWMFEKWLSLSEGLSPDIVSAIRSHIRGIYSERGNWLLKQKRYYEVLPALSAAARAELTPGIAAKWCLAAVAPALARRLVLSRERRSPERHIV